MRTLLTALCALNLLAACASAPTPSPVTAAQNLPQYAADASQAKVIFVRHTSSSQDGDFVVLDKDARYVATLRGDMHTVVTLTPGEHAFYVVAHNSEPLRATLEGGRTYVVETRPHRGFSDGSGVVVEVVTIERLSEVRGWMSTTPAMVPDKSHGAAWVAQRKRQIDQKIAKAEAQWQQNDVFWRKKHTVHAAQGLTANELGL